MFRLNGLWAETDEIIASRMFSKCFSLCADFYKTEKLIC